LPARLDRTCGQVSRSDHAEEVGPGIRLYSFCADPFRSNDRLLLHWSRRIPAREAFVEVLSKKGGDAPASFVLAGVDELVDDEQAIVDELAADEDAVAQSEPGGVRANQVGGFSGGAQERVVRCGD